MSRDGRSEAERAQDYLALFQTETGRRVMEDLARRFGYFTEPMFRGDATECVHRDGSRAVVAYIDRMMDRGLRQPPADEAGDIHDG